MTIKQILEGKGQVMGDKRTLSANPKLKVTIIKSKGGIVWVGQKSA